MDDQRITSPEKSELDHKEPALRPKELDQFIGQEKIKKNLRIFIEAAKQRNETMEHVLLYGPPGLGKTTLANICAIEMGVHIKITSGPAIERPGDLAAILTNLEEGDILFIDEIHRLNRSVEEVLYPAMEDFELDIVIGKGPAARSLRIDVAKFTLVGATTRIGLLSAPLRDRFGIIERLNFYPPENLATIIQRAANVINIQIETEATCLEVARRSRGTPRIANRLLKRIRDWAQIEADGIITVAVIYDALEAMGVDQLGLDELDIKYLKTIITKFNGGPVGVDTIAASLSEESDSIEDVIEPFMMQLGFIKRTPRGRVCCSAAYDHLNIEMPKVLETGNQQAQLF